MKRSRPSSEGPFSRFLKKTQGKGKSPVKLAKVVFRYQGDPQVSFVCELEKGKSLKNAPVRSQGPLIEQIAGLFPDVPVCYETGDVLASIQGQLRQSVARFFKHKRREQKEFFNNNFEKIMKLITLDINQWGDSDHVFSEHLMSLFRGTSLEKTMIFKEQIFDIFFHSDGYLEAYLHRHQLVKDPYWKGEPHLEKIVSMLSGRNFRYILAGWKESTDIRMAA